MYIIKNIDIEGTTLTTEVEFTLKDNSIKTVSIPHFNPETKEDVIVGIENMEVCLNKELDIPTILENIKNQLIVE